MAPRQSAVTSSASSTPSPPRGAILSVPRQLRPLPHTPCTSPPVVSSSTPRSRTDVTTPRKPARTLTSLSPVRSTARPSTTPAIMPVAGARTTAPERGFFLSPASTCPLRTTSPGRT